MELTEKEREMLEDILSWVATAPRDMILIMYGMMLSSSGKAAQ